MKESYDYFTQTLEHRSVEGIGEHIDVAISKTGVWLER